MALDVETPDPPRLHGVTVPEDYDAEDAFEEGSRREELARFLDSGAWAMAFDEWSVGTSLTEAEFAAVRDLDLVERFDFYWHEAQGDVSYRSPTLPEELPAPYDAHLSSDDREEIEAELDDLGRIVSEVLENDYVDGDGTEFGYDWE